ncbi:MAG: hypothetical protein J6U21_16255, partial [Bacteroidales bacterium]|nr:hypothetical protein [Bacteroidales bacterium]
DGIVFYCFPKIDNCFIIAKFFAKILSEKKTPPPHTCKRLSGVVILIMINRKNNKILNNNLQKILE